MIKQTDFDNRVDIIPVSDPNIFSMSQRITLAQTQLQLAQANPQIHNQYEAYRRMYQAMGVQNIDAILPPPPKPMPMDAAMENSQMLLQKPAVAFPQQAKHTQHTVNSLMREHYLIYQQDLKQEELELPMMIVHYNQESSET